MSLITAEVARGHGYLSIPLPRPPGDEAVLTTTLVRRSCGRRTSRAVLYVHCLHDPYVQPDLASWYLERGFDFYVADLRAARPRSRDAALAEYFGHLDAAARHIRDADGKRVVLVSAHRAGAVIAALWCNARGRGSADALILADPEFGPGEHWLSRLLGLRPQARAARGAAALAGAGAASQPRLPEVLAQAQRKLRRGLEIACPVLVMSPSAVSATAAGAAYRALPAPRLGPHVTAIRLATEPPGLARPDRTARRERQARGWRYDELGRWLGAYISHEIRDQLFVADLPVTRALPPGRAPSPALPPPPRQES